MDLQDLASPALQATLIPVLLSHLLLTHILPLQVKVLPPDPDNQAPAPQEALTQVHHSQLQAAPIQLPLANLVR